MSSGMEIEAPCPVCAGKIEVSTNGSYADYSELRQATAAVIAQIKDSGHASSSTWARYSRVLSLEVVLGLLDEIDTLRVLHPVGRPAPHPPETCCGNASWRGYLCPYHSGYRDGWDDYDEDVAERAIWDEMTGVASPSNTQHAGRHSE